MASLQILGSALTAALTHHCRQQGIQGFLKHCLVGLLSLDKVALCAFLPPSLGLLCAYGSGVPPTSA